MGNTRQQYVWIHDGVAKRNEFGAWLIFAWLRMPAKSK